MTNSFSAFWRSIRLLPPGSVSTSASERSRCAWRSLSFFKIQANLLQNIETIIQASEPLLDLEFVPRERLYSRAELFIAAGFEFIEGGRQLIATQTQFGNQGIDACFRCAQGYKLGLGFIQFLLEPVQRHQRFLQQALPCMDQRYVLIQFLQAIGKAVLVVVDLEIRKRPPKLT